MSTDFGRVLREIEADARGAARGVDVDLTRSRVRRRRTQAVASRAVGGAAAVGAVVVAIALAGGRAPTPHGPVHPAGTPSTTATVTASPCGADVALDEVDDPDVEIRGQVVVGTLQPDLSFEDDSAGSALHVDVSVTPDVPAGPFDGGDRSDVTTMLVAPDGRVAFWSDPARQISRTATDGSGAVSPDGVYDAVDCGTGQPLTGTYRAYATTATNGSSGGETTELAPVVLGPGDQRWAGQWPDLVPTCGRPAPADLLDGTVDADLTVALDPGADLDDVRRGLHTGVTVTAAGPGRLTGRVPQALHAVLVDRDGTVVSRVYDPTRQEYDSGATFDVEPGESFRAEVSQWFATCPDADRYQDVAPGSYDLYVYSVLLAAGAPDRSPSPRIAVGGPFPVTLR
ncbi:hypothetical protein OMK64_04870 [Cellulomonas fimi]|uniref:hypothetical protein n=1 Tax=Cellulomonas fimi TaxID=1708 RepID=UPI00234CAE2C|nr:hypothetical protein [Cellulomonas fimi]MDC7120860.1 hypothetical protein [Cellulomonas fimi]